MRMNTVPKETDTSWGLACIVGAIAAMALPPQIAVPAVMRRGVSPDPQRSPHDCPQAQRRRDTDHRIANSLHSHPAHDFQIHPGAVYIHQGDTLLVEDLDLETHVATGHFGDIPYYTQTEDQTDLSVKTLFRERQAGGVPVSLGEVTVSTKVLGFKKKRQFSDEIIWEIDDKVTGRPASKVVMKAGDVAAMPADIRHRGYSPKRSMLLVWENNDGTLPQRHASGELKSYPVEF